MRFHVACADSAGNVELFMQAGFARYGDELVLFRQAEKTLPDPLSEEADARLRDPADPAARRTGARPPVCRRHAATGAAPRGLPAAGLGAPGFGLARAALIAHADPPLCRHRGVPAGSARERQRRFGRRQRHSSGTAAATASRRSPRSRSPRKISRTISRSLHDRAWTWNRSSASASASSPREREAAASVMITE